MACTVAIPKFKKDWLRKYMQSKYTISLLRVGAIPVWIDPDDVEKMLRCDGLLMPGGEDVDPARYGQAVSEKCGKTLKERDAAEVKLLDAFLPTGKPVFGICRGVQMLNVYLGGTLHQDIKDIARCSHEDWKNKRTGNHKVTVCTGSRLAEIFEESTFTVNSLHHQAVDTPAPIMKVAAISEDGIIEAIEHPDHKFCIGVQWHPEHMTGTSKLQKKLFRAFVAACKEK